MSGAIANKNNLEDTLNGEINVEVSHRSLTQHSAPLSGPIVRADKFVLFGTPAAEN